MRFLRGRNAGTYRWAAVAVAVLLACCAIAEAQQADQPPIERSDALGRQCEGYFAVDLLFACDRKWNVDDKEFGAERGGGVSFGSCEISIPQRHRPGRLEEPGVFRSEKPEKHVMLSEPARFSKQELFGRLRDKLRVSRRREVLVFVHGAITTFEFSSRRVGQIAHDIEFDGPVVLYSWPSEGRVSGYLVDKANAEWTLPHLVAFLTDIAERSGAERIHILAHSMGVDLIGRAARELNRRDSRKWAGAFDQVVFAAGDMDVEVFTRDFAPHVSSVARRVSIYVSDRDRALAGSRKIHKYPRLGDGARNSEIAEDLRNIDLIDVSEIAEDWSGHEYYGGNPRFLAELRAVLRGDTPAQRGLKRDGTLLKLTPSDEND